ncbi:MAG: hypothetical protein H0U34_05755 [Sphingomonas sp.]|nr:hypothetical protein [Sphingomonas sp.]
MNGFLIAACGAALISFCVHTFIGGRFAAKPLLAAEGLPKATIWLNYFTWHIATFLLLILSATFLFAGIGRLHRDAALVAAAIALMISLLSVAITLKGRIPIHRFPASYLLAATALLGLVGAVR